MKRLLFLSLVALFGAGHVGLTFLVAGVLVFTFRHVSRRADSGESVLGDLVHGWRVFVSLRWVVIVVAALTFLAWWLLGPEPSLTLGILSAVTVLVIAWEI